MTKNELIEVTKSDMVSETIPLMESEGHSPNDVEIKWNVEDDGQSFIIRMEVVENETGECVVSKSRKVDLLEG